MCIKYIFYTDKSYAATTYNFLGFQRSVIFIFHTKLSVVVHPSVSETSAGSLCPYDRLQKSILGAFSFGIPVQPQREVVYYFDERQDATAEEKRSRAAEGN